MKAIESLNSLINQFPKSNYLDDAIFDLGNVFIATKNFENAISAFSRIHSEFPNSLFFTASKLKLGLVYYMKKDDDMAIIVLKEVISEFPNSNTSEEALSIIKNIYNELGQANKFLELLNNVDHDYTKSELDSSTFYSAELQYMQQNYQNAISALDSYLSYYPEGLFYIDANYFLYKSYENSGNLDKAMEFLNKIVNDKENKYTIEGLTSLAEISYELEKYISAEMYFDKLIEIAPTIDIKQKAILGLLESKFQLYKYNQVINTISELVEEDDLRIHYLKAYSLYKTSQNAKSLEEFQWLVAHSDGDLKAESFFHIAQLSYNMGDYSKCQEIIFQLINELLRSRVSCLAGRK